MPGHPALDIWTMVYSATDAQYRFSSSQWRSASSSLIRKAPMIISTFFHGLTDQISSVYEDIIISLLQWCTHPHHPHSRANQLEEDLKAYFDVLSGYMEEKVDYKEFREELEERRMKGITMDCKSCFWISFAGTSACAANHCQCSSLGVHADIESGQASEPRQAVGQVLEGGKIFFLANC